MNSTYIAIAILISSLCQEAVASANDLVQFPSGPAAWTIDVSASQTGSSRTGPTAGSDVTKVDVTQSDSFRCSQITFTSGKSRASWSIVGADVVMLEDPNGTAFITPPTGFFRIPYLPSVFNWVTPQLQQGKTPVSYQGRNCFHYKGPSGEAWIDSKTLQPVALDDGTSLASFTFHPPPITPLELPQKFKEILRGYRVNMGLPRTKQTSN